MFGLQGIDLLVRIILISLLALSSYKILKHFGNIIIHYLGAVAFRVFVCALNIDILFYLNAINAHWTFQALMVISIVMSMNGLRRTYELNQIIKELDDISDQLKNVTSFEQLIRLGTRIKVLKIIAEKNMGKKLDSPPVPCYDAENKNKE